MKKNLFVLILCGILGLFMMGCSKNEFDIGKKSDVVVNNNLVSLSLKEETLTNNEATFILKNNSSEKYYYGEPYSLEIYENDSWYSINVQLDFIMIAYEILPNETKELKINWENGYGNLSKGKYRIIKNVNSESESFYVGTEFVVK